MNEKFKHPLNHVTIVHKTPRHLQNNFKTATINKCTRGGRALHRSYQHSTRADRRRYIGDASAELHNGPFSYRQDR